MRLNQLIHIEHLEKKVAHSKHLMNKWTRMLLIVKEDSRVQGIEITLKTAATEGMVLICNTTIIVCSKASQSVHVFFEFSTNVSSKCQLKSSVLNIDR